MKEELPTKQTWDRFEFSLKIFSQDFIFDSSDNYSNLLNKRAGMITEFLEKKTLIDVSRLFFISENYFN